MGEPNSDLKSSPDLSLLDTLDDVVSQPLGSFRRLCEDLPAGAFALHHHRIAYVNSAMAQLLGQEADSLVGARLLDFVQPHDVRSVEEYVNGCHCGEERSATFEFRIKDTAKRSEPVKVHLTRLDCTSRALIGMTIFEAAEQASDTQRLQEQLEFERMLANLSAGFVNLPCDQLDNRIDEGLRTIVQFLGNDRSTFVEFVDDENEVSITHSYAVPGCQPFPLGPFAVARLPWFINEFRRGKSVFIRSVLDDLPPDADGERQYCLKHGIKSNVTVSLKAGGIVMGGLTFAFIKKPCEWSSEVISRLQLIGEVFANALLRRRTDQFLREAMKENEQLRQRLEQDNHYLREQITLKHHHQRIIGRSSGIMRVLTDAERVAKTDAPVLLTGETGTGKELIAQTIHEQSNRYGRPMIIVNCASLPATLIESELFGRVAGAYTGAASAQPGRFELADGSTLFLDEIGELPLELQAKLLRVLQDGRFERLGSLQTVTVDVRIVAATNRNLEQANHDGRFRADLYHRLNVFPIRIPPLRERRDDIPLLTWAYVESIGRRMGKVIKHIPRSTMQRLEQYDWPGNVRELSNTIERAMILTDDDTLIVELPSGPQSTRLAGKSLKQAERDHILGVLEKTGWRIRGSGGAAEVLELKPTTLEARMAKLEIKRPGRSTDSSRE
ncbi:sigma 54-interacting transcriptional regulator [Roseiconus lacunae]|uniref:Sigma 54-interacting transcriptional regulator n=1 Tax=Roseiconus lacunae TaxID=2605694 RepID=A0ABT7PP12_9BACT|nr:sigma 54-interacting transcriptional regulator [Roseiconus lacunae]MDM4018247.1 sigma 54-interacting transcriptional regulator [Roseiconus lacunae]